MAVRLTALDTPAYYEKRTLIAQTLFNRLKYDAMTKNNKIL